MKQKLQLNKKANRLEKIINNSIRSGRSFHKGVNATFDFGAFVVKTPKKSLGDIGMLALLSGATLLNGLIFAVNINELQKEIGLNK